MVVVYTAPASSVTMSVAQLLLLQTAYSMGTSTWNPGVTVGSTLTAGAYVAALVAAFGTASKTLTANQSNVATAANANFETLTSVPAVLFINVDVIGAMWPGASAT